MGRLKPYVHMGLTSEDVNNIAYALMMSDCMDEWNEKAVELIEKDARAGRKNQSGSYAGAYTWAASNTAHLWTCSSC